MSSESQEQASDGGARPRRSETKLFDRAGEIFLAVRELGLAAREDAIERACSGDAELRKIVLLLLRGDEAPLPVESLADDIRAAREGVSTIESAAAVAATSYIGNFKLIERIGEGGFGIVFLAEQERPVQRRVALKIIKLGMDTKQVVARFEAERQALALMDHPSIAKVFDAGATETGRPYFVMELVRGLPITEYCDLHKLSIRDRLTLVMQVCDALQHAHQRGVIHRDIKPSNVLVCGGEKPLCKIIDFGIAKATSARLTEKTIFTEFRQMIGTPEYMSPEQAGERNEDVDTRTDVYAAGVLLYELLTGATPFDSKRLRSAAYGEMQRIIREEDPPAPSTKLSTAAATLETVAQHRSVSTAKLAGVIKGELDWIVMKAIEKDRTRRYESAGSMRHDIERYLAGEAVHAAPPGAAYRAKKFVRRHRGPVIAVTLLAVTLVAGLIGTSVGFFNAEQRRKDAVWQKQRADDKAIEAEKNAAAERRARIELEYQSYVANLQSASALLDTHQCGLVTPILAKCPERLRAWEWRWLAARADTSLAALHGHGEEIVGLSISEDGTRVATAGGDDRTARVWDVVTGKEVAVLSGHKSAVVSVSLSADGSRAVTASVDGVARVFDAATGTSLFDLEGHKGRIYRAVFSPDGKSIATASADTTAKIWNARTGALLHTLEGHEKTVNWVAYSRDGTRVVTASDDCSARIWDATTGEQGLVLPKHMGWANQSEFSSDGSRVLVRAWGPSRVWDARTGALISELGGNGDVVTCVAFNKDATRVVGSSLDGRALVYDAGTGEILLKLIGHQHFVNSAAFSPDGLSIVTASADRIAIVWNANTGARIGELVGHSGRLTHVGYTPDGAHIVTTASDHSARIWDSHPAEASAVIDAREGAVYHAEFSPDSSRVVLPMINRRAEVYSTATGQRLTELLGHTAAVWAAAFNPDGSRIVTSSFDKTARVWDAVTGKELLVLAGHTDLVVKGRYNHRGDRIATTSHDGTTKLWDATTGACLMTLAGHTSWVLDVNFSSDDKTILTASNDTFAKLWDASSGELIRTFEGHTAACASAVFSNDGKRILTGSRDHTARIWDTATGKILATPVHTSDWISTASFSPDCKRVLVSLDEGSAILYDTDTATVLTEFRGHKKHVVTAEFSPDGTMVLTTSMDGFARIWHSIPYRDRLPRIERARAEAASK